MSFTYLEALAELNDPANAVKYSTWDAILNLAKSTSGDVLDTSGSSSVAERLLYNGKLPNGSWGSDVARELTNNGSGKYVSIFESEVGKLLSSSNFQAQVTQVTGLSAQSAEFKVLLNGYFDSISNTRINGAWDFASTNYIRDAGHGSFSIFTDKPTLGSTFAVNELEALVTRTSGGMKTTIQGLPATSVLNVYSNAIVAGVGEAVALSNLGAAINAAGELRAMSTGIAAAATAGMSAADATSYVRRISETLAKAGPYAVALSALLVAGQASAAAAKGDNAEAQQIVAVGAAEITAGLAGGYVGSIMAVAAADAIVALLGATSALGALGPIGAAASFIIAISGGLIAGYAASNAAKSVVAYWNYQPIYLRKNTLFQVVVKLLQAHSAFHLAQQLTINKLLEISL